MTWLFGTTMRADVCRLSSSSVIVVVFNAAGGRAGRPPGASAVGRRRAGRVRGWAADTARRANTVTSR